MSELATKFAGSGLALLYTQLKSSTGNGDPRPEFLDPLCACVKLGILEYRPLDTKISIYDHRIHHQEPGMLQGIRRIVGGDVRTQLQQLHLPILYVRGLELGHVTPDTGAPNQVHLRYINALMVRGLRKFLSTYERSRGDYALVKKCLENYLWILANEFTKESYEREVAKLKKPTLFVIYNEFMKKWHEDDLQMIVFMCGFAEKNASEKYRNEIANSIDHFITAKDLEIESLRPD